jgi:hypothetical protein
MRGGRGVSLSELDTALAGDLAAVGGALSVAASGDYFDGVAAHCRPRAFAQREGTAAGGVNHISDVDAGIYPDGVAGALPAPAGHRDPRRRYGSAAIARAGAGILRGIYDRLLWTLGVSLLNLFPLPREAGFRRSFAYAGEAVDRGYSVLVFPEGRHTADGKMNPFRAGIGLLAAKTSAFRFCPCASMGCSK